MTNLLHSVSKMFRIKQSYRDSTYDDGNLILHDDVVTFLCRRTHTNWVFIFSSDLNGRRVTRASSWNGWKHLWTEKRVEPDASTFSCLSERFCAMIRTSFFIFAMIVWVGSVQSQNSLILSGCQREIIFFLQLYFMFIHHKYINVFRSFESMRLEWRAEKNCCMNWMGAVQMEKTYFKKTMNLKLRWRW